MPNLARHADLGDIDGWLHEIDVDALNFLLLEQRSEAVGDLVEVGCFQGKCSVLLGFHLGAQEVLRVVDLFGSAPQWTDNQLEVDASPYAGLSVESFLANYGKFHDRPPETFVGDSEDFLRELGPTSVRLVHIDGSHTFGRVSVDLSLARAAIVDNGLIVVDDYRTAHTPGVAAAVWPLISDKALFPLALTPYKLYATTEPVGRLQDALAECMREVGYTVEYIDLGAEAPTLTLLGNRT